MKKISDRMTIDKLKGSFRDPSGFLFKKSGNLYRQINNSYSEDYDYLINSGLYKYLVSKNMLIEHQEIDDVDFFDKNTYPYKVIAPKKIPFISYPYEWSFSQLKDAALLTLDIQFKALSKGMILKDASAYNVQFINGRPIFIDTLSFEIYKEGSPWVAYKQFCQHFLAPLALMSYVDIRISKFLVSNIDGIPLDFASKVLPLKTKFSPSLFSHIHLHASSQNKYSSHKKARIKKQNIKVSKNGMNGLIDSLKSATTSLKWKGAKTEWGDYYDNTNYSDDAIDNKKLIIRNMVNIVKPIITWDLGANTGVFSQEVINNVNTHVVSWDIDEMAVEKHYLSRKKDNKDVSVLPLILDITNPSPGIGWANNERMSFSDRGKVDLIIALAIIHHLAISNNLPLEYIAEYFSKQCESLIIEFVPKSDSQVKHLLLTREDIFEKYTKNDMEESFSKYFTLERTEHIQGSERIIYLYKNKYSK